MLARFIFLTLTVTGLVSTQAVAANDLSNLQGIGLLTGTCEKLIAEGHDFTSACQGKILQSAYKTGRTGFTLVVGDKGTVLTFTGIQGAKPDEDTQLQSVDAIILNLGIEGVPPTTTSVTGSCAYSNPYKGPTTISCQATDAAGKASMLVFRSDGSPPVMTDLTDTAGQSNPTGAQTEAFSIGPWSGGRVGDDPDGGCVMAMSVGPQTLYAYTNSNETFQLGVGRSDWNLVPDRESVASLAFDGADFPVTGRNRNKTIIMFDSAGEEERGLADPFRRAKKVTIDVGSDHFSFTLTKSATALDRLEACALP